MAMISIGHVFRDKGVENGVYIGRGNPKLKLPDSLFRNPYPVEKYGRHECIQKYKTYITDKIVNDPIYMKALGDLGGSTLLCWCQSLDGSLHKECHGEVLRDLYHRFYSNYEILSTEHIDVLYTYISKQNTYMDNPPLSYDIDEFTQWLYKKGYLTLFSHYLESGMDAGWLPAISRRVDRTYRLECISLVRSKDLKRQRLIVAGSREFTDTELVRPYLLELYQSHKDSLIISGMARGADMVGLTVARELGLETVEYPAKWNRPDGTTDRSAGYARNCHMASMATHLLAFHNGQSKGTAHMIKLAAKYKLYSRVIPF